MSKSLIFGKMQIMRIIRRYLKSAVKEDLKDKMVFISGPRQAGKTTLALSLLNKADPENPAYLNYDYPEDRRLILNGQFPSRQKLIIFDEIHKYARWRNLIKGFYDKYKNRKSFLVTGSARFSHYRRGGDSLLGRYYLYRLHPFSLMEVNKNPTFSDLKNLLKWGGFPEPFLKSSSRILNRWHKNCTELLVHEDIRDLRNIRELSLMEVLVNTLPEKVGSPLSIKSLMEDLQVAHKTMEQWISILESFYFCFRIPPFGSPRIRAVKKEQKLYLFDWSVLSDKEGICFENLVAGQLLKYCHFLEDTEGFKMELRFLRDTDKREVDFVVIKNSKPIFAVECKSGDQNLSSAITYFKKRTSIPVFYQVHLKKRDVETSDGRILPFTTFCKELNMP